MKCNYCKGTGKILLLYSFVDCECVEQQSNKLYSIPKNPNLYDKSNNVWFTCPPQVIGNAGIPGYKAYDYSSAPTFGASLLSTSPLTYTGLKPAFIENCSKEELAIEAFKIRMRERQIREENVKRYNLARIRNDLLDMINALDGLTKPLL